MVGRSNEISREICREQVVDSRDREIGEWGPLQAEWSRPGEQHVAAHQRERSSDIGQNWKKRLDRSQSSHSSDEAVQQNAVERRGIGKSM